MRTDYPDAGRKTGHPARPPVHRLRLDFDVTETAALGGPARIAVTLLLPGDVPPSILFACVPGGGMNGRYYDLPTPPGEAEVSFALAMAAQGHAVAMIDPLGVGESSVPADGFALHPDRMAAGHAVAIRHILDGLRAGTLTDACPAAPALRSIGVGHSMGALLTIVQQAADPIHDAIALFGFHTGGLPSQLGEADIGLDPADTRARLIEITRARFPDAFVALQAPPSSRPVSAAVAIDRVYLTPSYMAMLPGMIAADAAAIAVPVMIALGDGDLHAEPHRTPAAYAGSPDITLIVLPDTRHNHFLYPSRTRFFDRVARWAEAL